MTEPETLGAEEAAALLHAECATVMQYARKGQLPGTRIGKSWVFLREDVIAFLRAQIAADTEARRRQAETPAPLAVALSRRPGARRRTLPDLHALAATASKRQ